MSLKDEIKAAANKNKGTVVRVSAWDVPAYVRVMTGTERDAFEGQIIAPDGKMNKDAFRAKLIAKTLSDENGNRLFSDDEIGILSEFDSVELDRLYTIAAKVNGLTKNDVDELTKN